MKQIPDHPMIQHLERDGCVEDCVEDCVPDGFDEELEDDQYAIPDDERDEEDYEEAPAFESDLICVTQLPVIRERLRMVKESVELAVREAASMVCTADTVQAVKNKRAELRKQFDELEEQRKAVKTAILAPYNDFEAVYKECISGPFKAADAELKAEIDGYEAELKAACKEGLRGYFDELCEAHGVDFLNLETAMNVGKIKISMADATAKTPRRLMDALSETVAKVATGMDQVMAMAMDDAVEIMAEYKECLDVGHAVACVQGRKRRIEAEKEAAEARRSAQERREAAAEKVAALMPPEQTAAPEKPKERLYRITFTVTVTRDQGLALKKYLETEGISYE